MAHVTSSTVLADFLSQLRDSRDRREIRFLSRTLIDKYEVEARGADAGRRYRNRPRPPASPTELQAEAHVRVLAERRREHTHRRIMPLANLLSSSAFPVHEREFAAVLAEQRGKTTRLVEEATGLFQSAADGVIAAKDELTSFAVANGCSESEDWDSDAREVYASAGVFVLVETVVGAGVFGDVSVGGAVQASALGAAIGIGNVVAGCSAAILRQASYRRGRLARILAVAGPAALAAFLTLLAAHYRLALMTGASKPELAAIKTVFSDPTRPFGSLTVGILVAVAGYAFIHMMRTWLKVYGRVPGHRERVAEVERRKSVFSATVLAAAASVSTITEDAKTNAKAVLMRARQRRDDAASAAKAIYRHMERFVGEMRTMVDALVASHRTYADAGSVLSGEAWASRELDSDEWAPTLAVSDPGPDAELAASHCAAVERGYPATMNEIEQCGAAAHRTLNILAKSSARGMDIVPDLSPNGDRPKGLIGGNP